MSENFPTVSVIIPARNAAAVLPRALDSVDAQDYPNIVDVVVAAADSRSADVAQGRAIVVDNPEGSTPAGLNLAIAAASGDIVVRCDAQSLLPPDYVSRAVATMLKTGADNVGGRQNPLGHTPWEEAIARAMSSRLGAGDARYRVGGEEGPVETVYLGVFDRKSLVRVGGFDQRFFRTQDFELNHRIIASGGVVWFDPSLIVEYRPRSSLGQLGKQYFQYGRAKRAFHKMYPGSLRWRQLAPPLLVVLLGASLIASIFIPAALLVVAGYLLSVFIGTFPRWRTSLALITMHLSWGVGFLSGSQL